MPFLAFDRKTSEEQAALHERPALICPKRFIDLLHLYYFNSSLGGIMYNEQRYPLKSVEEEWHDRGG